MSKEDVWEWKLTGRSRFILDKLTKPQLVNKFSTLLKPEGLLPFPQESTCLRS